ncbi:MAG: hypothetical protein A3J51_01980 [Omnitrophica WOR_2 bacterium RIFCSPHIGHO2_02_FULL_45_21]|nr:MAG: hypothetical protein A3J51_01980 [Omnitrophica WOR_2 bacterium RIFCSPHIGHO2_02_FULL_45_21]
MQNKGFVYILRSLKNNKFYIGSSSNLVTRFRQHQLGYVKATRYIRPLKLELFQEYSDINLARAIEQKLKKLKRKDYVENIIRDGSIAMGP